MQPVKHAHTHTAHRRRTPRSLLFFVSLRGVSQRRCVGVPTSPPKTPVQPGEGGAANRAPPAQPNTNNNLLVTRAHTHTLLFWKQQRTPNTGSPPPKPWLPSRCSTRQGRGQTHTLSCRQFSLLFFPSPTTQSRQERVERSNTHRQPSRRHVGLPSPPLPDLRPHPHSQVGTGQAEFSPYSDTRRCRGPLAQCAKMPVKQRGVEVHTGALSHRRETLVFA